MRYKILTILCLAFILWFTIQPVEMNWTMADIRLTEAVCGVSVFAVLMLVWRKQQMAVSTVRLCNATGLRDSCISMRKLLPSRYADVFALYSGTFAFLICNHYRKCYGYWHLAMRWL